MKENSNITNNNNNNYINKIKELEKEIEKYKNYCLLPGEKLITIKFNSIDRQSILKLLQKRLIIFQN